ncbi:MAG: transferrin-binding protein-like solute binding protein, partial [Campylobacterales bacterium]
VIPEAGTYTYEGSVHGHFTTNYGSDSESYVSMSGTNTINIDFDNAIVDHTLNINDSLESINWTLDGYEASLNESTGSFSGGLSGDGLEGHYQGQLYGNEAQRAAGTFNALDSTNKIKATGVFRADKK